MGSWRAGWRLMATGGGRNDDLLIAALAAGHQLLISHQGIMHVFSLLDQKLLWSRHVSLRPGQNHYYYGGSQQALTPMASRLTSQSRSRRGGQAMPGLPALVTTDVVCQQGRQELTVCDSLTGELLWVWSRGRHGGAVSGSLPPYRRGVQLRGGAGVLFASGAGNLALEFDAG